MNRAISIILIPLLLVSQSLFSVPHSHAGTSMVEPDGHSARPHFHLHSHSHADHHHGHDEGQAPTNDPPRDHVPDHDSDAVFAGDFQLLNDGKVVEIPEAELSVLWVIFDDSASVLATRCLGENPSAPPPMRPKCALFLQLLSIRC